jgi:hypothetical protein
MYLLSQLRLNAGTVVIIACLYGCTVQYLRQTNQWFHVRRVSPIAYWLSTNLLMEGRQRDDVGKLKVMMGDS